MVGALLSTKTALYTRAYGSKVKDTALVDSSIPLMTKNMTFTKETGTKIVQVDDTATSYQVQASKLKEDGLTINSVAMAIT